MGSLPIDSSTSRTDTSLLGRRIRAIEKRLGYLATATSTVGRAAIDAGKSLFVRGGGSLVVQGGGGVLVDDGGQVTLANGGSLEAFYESGLRVMQIGRFNAENANLQTVPGTGMRVLADALYGGTNIQRQIFNLFRDDSTGNTDASFSGVNTFQVTSGEARIYGQSGGAMMAALAAGDISLIPGTGRDVMVGSTRTTSSAANLYINPATGSLARSTSSKRYKQDVAAAKIDAAAVLKLIPRRFRTRAEVAELGDAAPTHIGFIAEEAWDAGLHDWVYCDEEGPESFDYASFSVAQQSVLQHQAGLIADLIKRVQHLEDPR